MAADHAFIRLGLDQGVAILKLDRPPLNVLNIPMLAELQDALDELADRQDVRALVLAAGGKMFSAGVDIADHTPEKVGEMLPLFHHVCTALADFPVPTIAAVHGHALGGGCELVLCCDMAVMSEGARIGQPEIQLAAVAPVAALRLPYLTGYRTAADLMFTGRAFTAAEALPAGLVNAVVSQGETETWAVERARQIAGLSRAALLRLKPALLKGYGSWAAGLGELENMYLDDLMQTEDAREGLAAFMEKRPPAWTHR